MDDATGTRLDKLYSIISESRYGIHDLSCTELFDGLPRFNMPLELGFFLAAKKYGGDGQKDKRCIIFDAEEYRYQRFISDLNGSDIQAHDNDPRVMARKVRDFLYTVSRRKTIPTPLNLLNSYDAFQMARPALVAETGLGEDELLFADYEKLAIEWVEADEALGSSI